MKKVTSFLSNKSIYWLGLFYINYTVNSSLPKKFITIKTITINSSNFMYEFTSKFFWGNMYNNCLELLAPRFKREKTKLRMYRQTQTSFEDKI